MSGSLPLDIKKIQEFLKTQPIIRAWVFGSYARGDQTSDSDVDILVDFDKSTPFGLFKLASIIIGLEDIFGKKVDLVERARVYPYIKQNIEAEKILIYERI